MPNDSITHRTEWRLEKRAGSVENFILMNREEGSHLLEGGRPSGAALDQRRFMENMERIQAWLSKPGLNQDVKRLWTPDRQVDAALHRMYLEMDPYEVLEREGNIIVTAGIAVLLNLLKGDSDTVFSNANSYLGVGDSTTGTNVAQTDLQASTNKLRKAMNATYPVDSAPTITFQSTFGSAEANFVWNEVGTFNGPSGSSMLNRVVQSLGTKSSGSSWSLTETITWS